MPSYAFKQCRSTFPIVLSLCLAACGGGGGGGGGGASVTPPAVVVPVVPVVPAPPVAVAPAITAQPQSVTVAVGASASFSVSATGDAPLSYQWQRNGVDLAGATGAQYQLTAAQWNDSGAVFSVVVRNGAGSVTSAGATLKVTGTALLAGSQLAKSFVNADLVGIAQDAGGTTYLLDRATPDALYKVSVQGVTTRLPLSPRDGDIALYQPTGLARDTAGNFYVADRTCAIRKISPAGVIAVLAGSVSRCGNDDGTGSDASFTVGSSALAVDTANNVYVAGHQGTIRKITPAGVTTTLAGVGNAYGATDGPGSTARFGDMLSIAVDGAGNLYVTDNGAATGVPRVRKITAAGVVSTLAGGISYGSADGQQGGASFLTLSGLTVDAAGNLYVGDQGNHSIRKISSAGVVTTFSGRSTTQFPPDTNPADGPASTATFRQPVAMTIDASGAIFLAESYPGLGFNALRKISADGSVTTIAGTQAGRGAADGTGTAASFSQPRGLAVDSAGTVWVADTGNQLIRRITPAGAVSTLAGAPGMGMLNESGDGKGSLARFFQPSGIVVDSHGTAFVADAVHNTIRKVLADGTVTTLAGQAGRYGAVDGPGAAAIFASTTGIAADRNGTLFVSDYGAVRRVDPVSGAVTTLAGLLGPSTGSTDGTGTLARFGYLAAIALDGAGNLYVVDSVYNNVRKITPGGVVTTLAGTAGVTGSADGQGAAASFNRPQGIAVDADGNVYVADTENNVIRRITPAGAVTTVAGQLGANGNVAGALSSPLSQPTGLAFDANGILYVCAGNGIVQLRF